MKPAPCDSKIFKEGTSIVALYTESAETAETRVKSIAKESEVPVDWHYSGGIANVLYLGDSKARKKVNQAINKLEESLDGTIMTRFQESDSGLYRKGVTEVPEGASCAFHLPGEKGSTFI